MKSIYTGNWTHLDAYSTHWLAGEDHLAIDELRKVCENLNSALGSHHLGYWNPDYAGYFPYILCQNIPTGEVTWKSIVEAWAKNDFEGRAWTIAMIDRMRQILWDEPFNIKWAARPEQEES